MFPELSSLMLEEEGNFFYYGEFGSKSYTINIKILLKNYTLKMNHFGDLLRDIDTNG